jgi:hypothetical protein
MQPDRPSFWRRILSVLGLAGTGPSAGQSGPVATAGTGHAPDPRTFEPGDLIWPKRKGAIVVRSQDASDEQKAWEAARDRLLAQPTRSMSNSNVAERLRTMRYEEFERLYFDEPPAEAATRGVDIAGIKLSVGHVGIIEIDAQGTPFVIEAVPTSRLAVLGGGVVARRSYQDWLAKRADNQLWHGRIKDLDRSMRKRVFEEAAKQVGKPYDFFNFDLNDDRSFYCSKLAWMSIWRAASIAVDDDPQPWRGDRFPPWYSPKQLLYSRRIQVLHRPGEF